MNWVEIVKSLKGIRLELAYAEFMAVKTKDEFRKEWEREAERLKVREEELEQMKVNYDMEGKV